MRSRDQTPRTNAGRGQTVSPARLAAFNVLRRVAAENAFATILLAGQEQELKENDRALCHELVMGVLRQQLFLDRLTSFYGNRDTARLDLPVRIALRLGLYQLRFLTRIPAAAAVNESVNLMRIARVRSAEGFVNAVLRRATREPEYNPLESISDPIERLSVETSHPAWLAQRWVKAFGLDETAALSRANNQPAPVAFRVVRHRANDAEVLEQLQAGGAEITSSTIVTGAWRVNGGTRLIRTLAEEGSIYIQDEASQLVAQTLGAQAGERVLDVCAAPGSKTSGIADRTGDQALIIAGDLHQHRLRGLIALAAAQELNSINCLSFDATSNLPFQPGAFDRVLVDAPCSGTGTLRRNPEIRWRISAADIDELARRQRRILLNASRMVRPGGYLLYSTCSVEPEENEQVVVDFLRQASAFKPAELNVEPALKTGANTARTWPQRDGSDGFFIALFKRYE